MLTFLMIAFFAWLARGMAELRRMTPPQFAAVFAGKAAGYGEAATARDDLT